MTELSKSDRAAFHEAYLQAKESLAQGGVPVGAALTVDSRLIAVAHNQRVQKGDPIAHGEMACLREAGRRRDYRSMTLFTTLAPCEMCSGAVLLFGIPRVIVGEDKTFGGSLDYLRSRGVDISVLDDGDCIALMDEFRSRYPDVWSEDIGK